MVSVHGGMRKVKCSLSGAEIPSENRESVNFRSKSESHSVFFPCEAEHPGIHEHVVAASIYCRHTFIQSRLKGWRVWILLRF